MTNNHCDGMRKNKVHRPDPKAVIITSEETTRL